MKIIKIILGILIKAIIGIFAFYLVLSLVLIPLFAPWVISSQAGKILKHPVKVKAVLFNPFLLRLNLKGFQIQDENNQVMAGFDKFWVDVSFISLFKKPYRVELVSLDGLKVNAVLDEKGAVNLLKLMPADQADLSKDKKGTDNIQAQKAAVARKSGNPEALPVESQPLPSVVVDLIAMNGGVVTFTDRSVKPDFTTSLNNITLRVTGVSTDPVAQANISYQARLDDKGVISVEMLVRPLAIPLNLETVFKLNDYSLKALTPYTGKFTGRAVKDGKLDLSMDYRIADNKLSAKHKVLVQNFDFGQKVESKDALSLPFGLALAILKDSQDRINISLPVTGDMSKPDFHYFSLLGQVLRNFFLTLVTKPFSFLGSIAGMESASEEFGYVRFSPGGFMLSAPEKEKLKLVAKVLNDRKNLFLDVRGSFDPIADWQAIKTDTLNKDFQVLSGESRRSESKVYQELYQRRFGIRDLWKLTSSCRNKDGSYDEGKIIFEAKRQLIDDPAVDKKALRALAEGRAKAIYDFIIAAGFDPDRASIGEVQESQISAGTIPLELSLRLLDDFSEGKQGPLLPVETKSIR